MPNITSREIRLASRPTGVPTADNFKLAETTLAPLQDQQVPVRNLFMSVDPYMRGRMNDRKSKRLTMKGLIVSDWLDRQGEFEKEAGAHYQAGKLKSLETVVVGLDQAPGAFIGLFDGKNVGKMLIRLSP